MTGRRAALCAAVLGAILYSATAASAAEDSRDDKLGPVTNLPLPRFVSIKAAEANARRGPSLSHRIDWVYHRANLPVEITAEYGHWRRIRDIDGAGGWVHYSLLSGARYVIVTGGEAPLYARPGGQGGIVARAEEGAIARLEECERDWCEIDGDGADGWVVAAQLWGAGTPSE